MALVKLTTDQHNIIRRGLRVAQTIDSRYIIFDTEFGSQAVDEKRQSLILDPNCITSPMPFKTLAITRIADLMSRQSLAQQFSGVEVFADVDSANICKQIVYKSNKTKIEFKCGNPNTIRVLRTIGDVMTYAFELDEDNVDLLARCVQAVKSEHVTFISNGENIIFDMADSENDKLQHQFTDHVFNTQDPDGEATFAFRYPAKRLLTILKTLSSPAIQIGARGAMHVRVEGISTYVLPAHNATTRA